MSDNGENGGGITSLGDLIDRYQAHLARGARNSVLAYAPLRKSLEGWRDRDPSRITGEEWLEWFRVHTAGLAPGTRSLRLRQLRAMHNFPRLWLGLDGFKNPLAGSQWRRVAPEPLPPYRSVLSEDTLRAMCNAPRTRRGKLLLRVMAERGRRLSEVLGIRVCDVRDLEAGSGDQRVIIFKTTKSKREQFSVLSPELAAELRAYVAETGLTGEAKLFPCSQQAVRACVRLAAIRVGVPSFSPHDFRRQLASRMERNGIPLGAIQSSLGHASSRMTERYIAPRSVEEMGRQAS